MHFIFSLSAILFWLGHTNCFVRWNFNGFRSCHIFILDQQMKGASLLLLVRKWGMLDDCDRRIWVLAAKSIKVLTQTRKLFLAADSGPDVSLAQILMQ